MPGSSRTPTEREPTDGSVVDELDVAAARQRFFSLQQGFAFFDAPGGSQVPDEVGDAIARALREASANLGAVYETSHRVGRILARGRSQGGAVPRAASHTR